MAEFRAPRAVVIEAPRAEEVRRDHAERIKELQEVPVAQGSLITGIELADATDTPISHLLGRHYRAVLVSPPRGPSSSGRIEEVRDTSYDHSHVVVLKATGFGATVTVDLWVF